MNPHSVDVLLVEDSIDDAELIIWQLKRHHMYNNLVHLKTARKRWSSCLRLENLTMHGIHTAFLKSYCWIYKCQK